MESWTRYEGSITRNSKRDMTCIVTWLRLESTRDPTKGGEHQYVSGVMGIAYNPFLDSEAGSAHRNHEVTELLKFWTEKIIEIVAVEREKPSLGLILEKMPEVISVPRSNKGSN